MKNWEPFLKQVWAFVRYRPLIPTVFFFATGIALGNQLALPLWIRFALLLAVCVFAVSLIALNKSKQAFISILAAGFFLGVLLIGNTNHKAPDQNHISRYIDKGTIELEGTIIQPVRFFADHTNLIVDVDRVYVSPEMFMPTNGRVLLRMKSPELDAGLSDRIRFYSKLRRIRSYKTPGFFNYAKFMARRNVFVSGYVKDSKSIQIHHAQEFSFQRMMDDARSTIRGFIQQHVPMPQREVLCALALGEKDRIPDDVQEKFRAGGTAHLLAISGMHIGGIFALVFFITLRLLRLSAWACNRFHIYKIAVVVALIPAFFYAELSTWRISALRAFIMVLIYAIAYLLGRQRDLLSTLSAAGIIILMIWPYALFEPAFQLSFSAVFGVVIVAPSLFSRLRKRSELKRLERRGNLHHVWIYFVTAIGSTLAALLATLPITVYHFGYFAPYTILTNLVMIPLYTAVTVPLTLLGASLIPLSSMLAKLFLALSGFSIQGGLILTGWIAQIPGAQIFLSKPSMAEILAYYLLFVSVYYFRTKGGKALFAGALVTLLCFPIGIWFAKSMRSELKVTVIDVGQGLSQLIEFPGGETWLVDGGGVPYSNYDIGNEVLAPFLRAKRIRTIDRVINTHPHPDHYDGLIYILNHFHVKEVARTRLECQGDERCLEFYELAKTKNQFVSADSPDEEVNGATVSYLFPPETAFQKGTELSDWSLNDRSLVMKLSFDGCSVLMPADAEKKAEAWLVENGQDLQADILVSPHHGSKTSSSSRFINAVNPKAVAIPVGQYNRYNLPSRQVLLQYFESGIATYRTDRDGAITIRCSKGEPNITTFNPAR